VENDTRDDLFALMRRPDTAVAVVGATDDPAKFGGRIYRDLKGKGFTVFPVNRGRDTVDGDPAFPSLSDLPATPTIVNLVVPPAAGATVLEECRRLGLTRVWLQPGAESPSLIDYLDREGFQYLAGACIMVESDRVA